MKGINGELSQPKLRDKVHENSVQTKAKSTIEQILFELVETSGLDSDTCEQILLMYIRQSLELLEQLKRALIRKDFDESKVLFHKLKGSSGNVRAYELMILADNSEKAIGDKEYDLVTEWVDRISEKLLVYQSAFML